MHPDFKTFKAVPDQVDFLLSVNWTMKRRESTFQPVTIFISSIVPSPNSFVNDRRLSRGIGSLGPVGHLRICIASGTTLTALLELSPECNTTGMRLSMYLSTFLVLVGGT